MNFKYHSTYKTEKEAERAKKELFRKERKRVKISKWHGQFRVYVEEKV